MACEQVAAVFRGVLTLRWASARVAHVRVPLPPLPAGLAFSRLHFSPDDAHLLLLPESAAADAALGVDYVTVCILDLRRGAMSTWQVSIPPLLVVPLQPCCLWVCIDVM